MHQRPIIVFDVNETLLDLEAVRPVFERIFNDPAAMHGWFAGLITYSEALTLAGVYVPFTEDLDAIADQFIERYPAPARLVRSTGTDIATPHRGYDTLICDGAAGSCSHTQASLSRSVIGLADPPGGGSKQLPIPRAR